MGAVKFLYCAILHHHFLLLLLCLSPIQCDASSATAAIDTERVGINRAEREVKRQFLLKTSYKKGDLDAIFQVFHSSSSASGGLGQQQQQNKELLFQQRGSIHLNLGEKKWARRAVYSAYDAAGKGEELGQFGQFGQFGMYFLRIMDKEQSLDYNYTIDLCRLAAASSSSSSFKEEITIHLDEFSNPTHIDYNLLQSPATSSSSSSCPQLLEKMISSSFFKTPIVVKIQQIEFAPRPRLEALPELKADGNPVADQVDNRSFIQKYWYYIIPLLIIMLMGGGDDQQQPQQGGGGGGATARTSSGATK